MSDNKYSMLEGTENVLEIKDLVVVYQTDLETVRAINNVSLKVRPGHTLGIVGETGAGKTTAALSIMRLLPERISKVLQGEILFNGHNLLDIPENEMREYIRGEEIAMIFQDPMSSLNPVMTVGDQILEALKYHNRENRSPEELNKRVDETLELVGLSASRKNEYPHQFSGGMKQRVVIAMALACEPGLLIADEPTTALDVTIQAQVLAMMSDLKSKLGSAIVIITHDLGVVAQICDSVAVMYAGEVIEYGTVEDIFNTKIHHPYTDGLFGSIPDLEKDTKRLSPIGGLMPDPTKLPQGCFFSDRCPKCIPTCVEEHPQYAHLSATHMILCHLPGEDDQAQSGGSR